MPARPPRNGPRGPCAVAAYRTPYSRGYGRENNRGGGEAWRAISRSAARAARRGARVPQRAPRRVRAPADADTLPCRCAHGGALPRRVQLVREEGTRRVQLVREEGTRRVQLVREGGGGGGARRSVAETWCGPARERGAATVTRLEQ